MDSENMFISEMTNNRSSRTIPCPAAPGRIITYTAPYERCDREADYAAAWAAFQQRGLI
jgi:hypothetical protein